MGQTNSYDTRPKWEAKYVSNVMSLVPNPNIPDTGFYLFRSIRVWSFYPRPIVGASQPQSVPGPTTEPYHREPYQPKNKKYVFLLN